MLRVTKDRKSKYVSLGISVNPEHWKFSKNQPKSDCSNREFIELMIAEKLKAYNFLLCAIIRRQKNAQHYCPFLGVILGVYFANA